MVYQNAPKASQIVRFPESTETDMEVIGAGFQGKRGRVMIRESTQVSAAGVVAPQADWRPQHTTPDITGVMPGQILADNRNAIMNVFGVLPALLNQNAQGPLVREAQRHLAGWTLKPIASLIAEEASHKLGGEVIIDTLRPVQAYDVGGRARALNAMVEAMARALEVGLSPTDLNSALTLANFGDSDRAARLCSDAVACKALTCARASGLTPGTLLGLPDHICQRAIGKFLESPNTSHHRQAEFCKFRIQAPLDGLIVAIERSQANSNFVSPYR